MTLNDDISCSLVGARDCKISCLIKAKFSLPLAHQIFKKHSWVALTLPFYHFLRRNYCGREQEKVVWAQTYTESQSYNERVLCFAGTEVRFCGHFVSLKKLKLMSASDRDFICTRDPLPRRIGTTIGYLVKKVSYDEKAF